MSQTASPVVREASAYALGAGPVGALLLHGFSGTPGEMRPLADYLLARGAAVEAPLLAGHGGAQEQLATATWRDWTDSARAGLDRLRARCSVVIVVGFSMGGAIGLYLAARTPIDGLACVSTPTTVGGPLAVLLPAARKVMPFVYPLRLRSIDLRKPEVVARLREYIPDLVVDSNDPAQIARVRRSIKVSVQAVYELSILLRVTRASISRVTVPTLLLQARRDEQVSRASIDYIYDRLGAADKARRLDFDRSGHMLLNGPEKEDVFADIARFVERVGAAAMAVRRPL